MDSRLNNSDITGQLKNSRLVKIVFHAIGKIIGLSCNEISPVYIITENFFNSTVILFYPKTIQEFSKQRYTCIYFPACILSLMLTIYIENFIYVLEFS
jgi:hypothetical protein